MTGAYYNEFDPKAAAWLRELIKAGEIPDGEVDERSISDVDAADLGGFTQCHFFAGIGGWSLALRLAGWPDDRPVWTGSCPCQPFSVAGKGAGTADERHLWPEFRRLIDERRPASVFGEQVASKSGRAWLATVRAEMEALGYAVGAADLCAAGIGAPHIRQRLWFYGTQGLADAVGKRGRGGQPGREDAGNVGVAGQEGGLADAKRVGREMEIQQSSGGGETQREREANVLRSDIALDGLEHPEGHGRVERGSEPIGRRATGGRSVGGLADTASARQQPKGIRSEGEARHETRMCVPGEISDDGGLADAERHGWGRGQGSEEGCVNDRENARRQKGDNEPFRPDETGDAGGLGVTDCPGPQPGRKAAEAPRHGSSVEPAGCAHRPRPLDFDWSDADWLSCTDAKWRPVEPGTFPLAHGISGRVGLLRGYGNAIVPQVAAQFIQATREAVSDVIGVEQQTCDNKGERTHDYQD